MEGDNQTINEEEDKVPFYIKMDARVHSKLEDFVYACKKRKLKELSSKKGVIDMAVEEFIENRKTKILDEPVHVKGLTEESGLIS